MSRNATIAAQGLQTKFRTMAIVAGVVLLFGLGWASDRVWSNLLVGAYFLVTLALGALVFAALTRVAGARWQVAFQRVPEALAATLPIVGAVILIVLAPKAGDYGWSHHGDAGPGTFWFKELWLTPSFWLLRSIGYVVIWTLLGRWLVTRLHNDGGSSSTFQGDASATRVAALFLVAYALTFSLASIDWIMALEPLWFSTMWGVYNFAGMILATLAAMVLVCVVLSGPGRPLDGVFTDDHLHDLSRLIVGFSCFWMYIWFSQYMLIWYSNIPEETSYFVTRMHGAWGPIVVASIVLNWVAPFFVLLPYNAKRSRSVMVRVAMVLLLGRWVDLVLMVFPSTLGGVPAFGVWEIAAIVCAASAGVYLVARAWYSVASVSQDVHVPPAA